MNTNDTATIHFLSKTDIIFFDNMIKYINDRIELICDANDLKGTWTVSSDHQCLVKTGD